MLFIIHSMTMNLIYYQQRLPLQLLYMVVFIYCLKDILDLIEVLQSTELPGKISLAPTDVFENPFGFSGIRILVLISDSGAKEFPERFGHD